MLVNWFRACWKMDDNKMRTSKQYKESKYAVQKKAALLLISLFLLVGCTRITSSKKDHEELSERIIVLDAKPKDYYEVSIEVRSDSTFNRYNYIYNYNDITETYYSTYNVNSSEVKYVFHDGLLLIKTSNNNTFNEQELEITIQEYKEKYVSLFGSKYNLDLKQATYKREESVFSFSNASYLKNYFDFNPEYEYHINLFDYEDTIIAISVEFGSIKNKNDTTLFDEFKINGKNNSGHNFAISIIQ